MVRGVATTTIAPLLARHLGESAQVFRGFANLKKRPQNYVEKRKPSYKFVNAENCQILCTKCLCNLCRFASSNSLHLNVTCLLVSLLHKRQIALD